MKLRVLFDIVERSRLHCSLWKVGTICMDDFEVSNEYWFFIFIGMREPTFNDEWAYIMEVVTSLD